MPKKRVGRPKKGEESVGAKKKRGRGRPIKKDRGIGRAAHAANRLGISVEALRWAIEASGGVGFRYSRYFVDEIGGWIRKSGLDPEKECLLAREKPANRVRSAKSWEEVRKLRRRNEQLAEKYQATDDVVRVFNEVLQAEEAILEGALVFEYPSNFPGASSMELRDAGTEYSDRLLAELRRIVSEIVPAEW